MTGRNLKGLAFLALWAVGVPAAALTFQAVSNLAGYWDLEEASGPTAADSSGNGNDGTHTGSPVVVTDVPAVMAPLSSRSLRVGPGLQYVELGNSAPLDTLQNNDYTISAWFKPASVPATTGTDSAYGIVMKAGYNEGLYYQSPGVFAMEHWTEDTGGGVSPNTAGTWASSYATDVWYHVVGVVDRSGGGETRLYLNGSPAATTAWAAPDPGWSSHAGIPWRIGVAIPGHANVQWQADGTIDDVRIYDRVLTDTEISILSSGLPAPTSLVATVNGSQIDLSWTAPSPAYSYTYTVYRGTATGGPYTVVTSGVAGTTFSDTPPAAGTTYFYVVTAVSVGESAYSAEATATTPSTGGGGGGGGTNSSGDDGCGCGSIGSAPSVPVIGFIVLLAGLLLVSKR